MSSFRLCLAFSLWAWGCGVCNLYSLVLNGRGTPLLTVAALVPGTLLILILAFLFAPLWGSVGVGAAFACGAALSASLMAFFALKEMRGISEVPLA
jgi:O-antigen/teichoic acid export membrane protein